MRIEELGIYSNIFQFFILKSSSKMYQKKKFPLRGIRGGGLAPPKTPPPQPSDPFKKWKSQEKIWKFEKRVPEKKSGYNPVDRIKFFYNIKYITNIFHL